MSDAVDSVEGMTLVAGLGQTGLSCVEYLRQRGGEVEVIDSRAEPPALGALRSRYPDVPVHLGGFSETVFARARRVVLSPGIALSEPAVRAVVGRGVPVFGDIELFARAANAPVLAVTGSNGKSTVATMLHAMARAAGRDARLGGNVGTPALDLLAADAPDLYVLELSSFQLETTDSLEPAVACVLNLSPDHLDRYDSLASYGAAKQRIFTGSGTMVLNADDPGVVAMALPGRTVRWFTLAEPRDEAWFGLREADGRAWLCQGERRLMAADALQVQGRHNQANALAALAMGTAAGLDEQAMTGALGAFAGLPHRMQPIAETGGVRWIDDSKATNPGAALAAIESCAGPVVLIAGGDGKGADFSQFADGLAPRVRELILLGADAARIEAAVAGRLPVHRVPSMAEAVATAARVTRAGDVVLLAPACSSLDMFRDYAHRGEVFASAVRELGRARGKAT